MELSPLPEGLRDTWWVLLDLAEEFPSGWTLIGAQMVALLAAEHGRMPPRSSRDADILVDARVVQVRPERIVRALLERGFEPERSPGDTAHRFRRNTISLDVLAPDGLDDARPSALITIPPSHTIQTPGGTQALARTERVAVRVAGREGLIPRPTLLGALIIKACAVDVSDHKDDQRQDFAFLLSLVADPRAMRAELQKADLRRLRARRELLDRTVTAWRVLGAAGEDAYRAFHVLIRDEAVSFDG